MIFWKKLLNIKCEFWFSLKLFWNISHSKMNWVRYYHKCTVWYAVSPYMKQTPFVFKGFTLVHINAGLTHTIIFWLMAFFNNKRVSIHVTFIWTCKAHLFYAALYCHTACLAIPYFPNYLINSMNFGGSDWR